MTDRMEKMIHNPPWWTDEHTSAWDRVRGALERDWEQTKADFARNSGHQLNQTVTDTVKQTLGTEPIPPIGMETRPSPGITAKEADEALMKTENATVKAADAVFQAHDDIARTRDRLATKVDDIQQKLADRQMSASDRIAEAKVKAAEAIAKAYERIDEAGTRRDDAMATWQDAEHEIRYGYSVRSRYPSNSVWDKELVEKLRGEWDGLHMGRPWDLSGTRIHRGWDYASSRF